MGIATPLSYSHLFLTVLGRTTMDIATLLDYNHSVDEVLGGTADGNCTSSLQ